jgi:hypothetical protein
VTARGATALREAGRYDEALALLRATLAAADGADRGDMFIAMLEWRFLAEVYAPAADALRAARDEQVARLLAGDVAFAGGADEAYWRGSRFALIVEMNGILDDARSTHDVFARLHADRPDLARRYAYAALQAVVEAGDYDLADVYRGEPLARLASVNVSAARLPLFPPPDKSPRLAAELSGLTSDVRVALAVLRGRGQHAEADTLRARMLDGLPAGPLRELAERELDAPGSITQAIVAHQMEQEPPAESAS